MNRSRWIALAVFVALAALAVLWWRARHAQEAPKFRTAQVERGSVELVVSATGTVTPVVQVEVGSQVSGTVAELFADYNSQVRKGQVLCQIEPSSFKAHELQAEAAVARAEAALLDGQRQYKRAQELIPENYVSQADVDAAEVQVRQREADLKQARAALQVARVDLDNTTIRAPVDGVVISRAIDRGQTVAASLSAPKLFVIANDLHAMQIETRIDESDIGVIQPGLPSTFTVDAFPDATFHGQVQQVRLEPIIEQNVVTYTTVIQARNPDLKLRPGMTANVTVLVSRRDDVLKVPNAALRFKPPMDAKRKGGRGDSTGGAAVASERGAGGRDGGAAHGDSTARGAGGALAPGGDPGGASARGAGSGASSPALETYRRELFGKVRSGELTREQATALMRDRAGSSGGEGDGRAAGGGTGGGAAARNWGGQHRGLRTEGADGAAGADAPAFKPGSVYVLRDGKPVAVRVLTGISDGAFTELKTDALKPGDTILVGLDVNSKSNLTPPPGMGGPMMGRGGGGGGRR